MDSDKAGQSSAAMSSAMGVPPPYSNAPPTGVVASQGPAVSTGANTQGMVMYPNGQQQMMGQYPVYVSVLTTSTCAASRANTVPLVLFRARMAILQGSRSST